MFYQVTLKAITKEIKKRQRGVTAQWIDINKHHDRKLPLAYILWMAEEVKSMDVTSLDMALKAARWIAWMLREVERQDFWDNDHSRELIRKDVKQGWDRPH